MSYKIEKLEDLKKIVDRMTADPENQWNELPQNVRDDLLRDVYERIGDKFLYKASKEVQQQEKQNKPKSRRDRKKKDDASDASTPEQQ